MPAPGFTGIALTLRAVAVATGVVAVLFEVALAAADLFAAQGGATAQPDAMTGPGLLWGKRMMLAIVVQMGGEDGLH